MGCSQMFSFVKLRLFNHLCLQGYNQYAERTADHLPDVS